MTKQRANHYKVLGVKPSASLAEIKQAYRRLAVKYHPDRNHDANAHQRFHLITEAYKVLSDDQQRRQYDKNHIHPDANGFKAAWQQTSVKRKAQQKSRQVDPWEIYQQAEREEAQAKQAQAKAAEKKRSTQSYDTQSQRTTERPNEKSAGNKNAYQTKQKGADGWDAEQRASAKFSKDDTATQDDAVTEAFINSDVFKHLFKQFSAKTSNASSQDATGSSQTQKQDTSSQQEVPKPARENDTPYLDKCYRCGCEGELLQYRRLYTAIATGRTSRIRVKNGKYCSDCFRKERLLVNLKTCVLGWWAPTGIMDSLRALVANNVLYQSYKREDNAWLAYHHLRKLFREGQRRQALFTLCYAYQITDDQAFKIQLYEQIQRQMHGARWRIWHLFARAWIFRHFSAVTLSIMGMACVALLALMLWQGISVTKLKTPITFEQQDEQRVQHNRLYPEFRIGENYVLSKQLYLRQEADESSSVVAVLKKYDALYVDGISESGLWLQVTTAKGQQGFVSEAYVGFGEARRAREKQCDAYPQRRIQNGTLLFSSEKGRHSLTVRNPHSQDALIQLVAIDGGGVYRFYVRNNQSATFQGIATGEYQLIQQRGQVFNPACGIFMKYPHNAQLEGSLSFIAKRVNSVLFYPEVEVLLP